MSSGTASPAEVSVKPFHVLTLSICVLAILAMFACGASSPKISIELMPNAVQTLEPGQALPISATLLNDITRKGVTWKLSGAGVLVAQTTSSVMYQSPSNIAVGSRATVTAIPIADGSIVSSLTIILEPPKQTESATDNRKDKDGHGAGR